MQSFSHSINQYIHLSGPALYSPNLSFTACLLLAWQPYMFIKLCVHKCMIGKLAVTMCRYLGLDSHLILRTSRELADSDPGLTGNLLLARMVCSTLAHHVCAYPPPPLPTPRFLLSRLQLTNFT